MFTFNLTKNFFFYLQDGIPSQDQLCPQARFRHILTGVSLSLYLSLLISLSLSLWHSPRPRDIKHSYQHQGQFHRVTSWCPMPSGAMRKIGRRAVFIETLRRETTPRQSGGLCESLAGSRSGILEEEVPTVPNGFQLWPRWRSTECCGREGWWLSKLRRMFVQWHSSHILKRLRCFPPIWC